MTGRPASSAVGSVVGAGAVSIVIVGSRSVLRLGGDGTGGNGRPFLPEGSQGVPLSRRRTCPDLAPCRLDAGRLSWLHRAGPSATLDKSSSVVRRSYGPKACSVNAPEVRFCHRPRGATSMVSTSLGQVPSNLSRIAPGVRRAAAPIGWYLRLVSNGMPAAPVSGSGVGAVPYARSATAPRGLHPPRDLGLCPPDQCRSTRFADRGRVLRAPRPACRRSRSELSSVPSAAEVHGRSGVFRDASTRVATDRANPSDGDAPEFAQARTNPTRPVWRGSRRSPGRSRLRTVTLSDRAPTATQRRWRSLRFGLSPRWFRTIGSTGGWPERKAPSSGPSISPRSGAGGRPDRGHGRGTAAGVRLLGQRLGRQPGRGRRDVQITEIRAAEGAARHLRRRHADDDIELAVRPVAADLRASQNAIHRPPSASIDIPSGFATRSRT